MRKSLVLLCWKQNNRKIDSESQSIWWKAKKTHSKKVMKRRSIRYIALLIFSFFRVVVKSEGKWNSRKICCLRFSRFCRLDKMINCWLAERDWFEEDFSRRDVGGDLQNVGKEFGSLNALKKSSKSFRYPSIHRSFSCVQKWNNWMNFWELKVKWIWTWKFNLKKNWFEIRKKNYWFASLPQTDYTPTSAISFIISLYKSDSTSWRVASFNFVL